MRILCTGHSGFIASHFIDLLNRDKKYDVVRFHGDITDEADVVRNLRNIDVVANFAAATFLPPSWDSPKAYIDTNLMGVINFLKNGSMFNYFYQQSTSHVYGNQLTIPIEITAKPLPNDPYSVAKLAAEEAIRAYSYKHGFKYLISRSFNNFGPRQSKKFVVPEFIEQALVNKRIIVRGDTQRELIYVKDNVRIIKDLIDRGETGLIHIAKNEPYHISAIANLIANVVDNGTTVEIAETNRPKDIQILCGSSLPLLERIPDFKFTEMRDAIQETVDFYRQKSLDTSSTSTKP